MKADHSRNRPPYDGEGLERLALNYVGRYATTCAKLAAYLARKLKERGWSGEGLPQEAVEAIVARMTRLGYVDDAMFARTRAASLMRRGYGEERVKAAFRAAGITQAVSAETREEARSGAWAAALKFAARRRVGPYAAEPPSREARQKIFAAMLRAGHSPELAKRVLDLPPGSDIEAADADFA